MSEDRDLLLLARVHAKDEAGPKGRARGSLNGASFAAGAGTYAVLGAPDDGTLALFDVVSGARAPMRGAVFLGGRDPYRSAEVRRVIGALGPEPQLPPARWVEGSVRAALDARGDDRSAREVLDVIGIGAFAPRALRSLRFAEERAVELALALTVRSPSLVVLFEPRADVAMPRAATLGERLASIASSGAVVLVITSSPSEARALADHVLVLHKGQIVRGTKSEGDLDGAGRAELIAWVRPSPGGDRAVVRTFASAVGDGEGVHGVAWSDADPPSSGGTTVRVEAASIDAGAAALMRALAEVDVILDAYAPVSPGLGRVRAATEALIAQHVASRASAPVLAPVAAPAPVPIPAPVFVPAPEIVPSPEVAPPPVEAAPPREEEPS